MVKIKGAYKMADKYHEIVKVEKIRIFRQMGIPFEGNVALSVVNRSDPSQTTVECFVYSDILKQLDREFKEGDRAYVELYLLNFRFQKSEETEKYANLIKPTPVSVNSYQINGELVEINPHNTLDTPNFYSIVIDCGLYVRSDVQITGEIKVGDYVHLEGRLDVHLMRRRNES